MGNSTTKFKHRRERSVARPSPTTMVGMAEFAQTLDDTFALMEGLQEQIVVNGNVATLTSAELDLLQRALHRLCLIQTKERESLIDNQSSYDEVSRRFIESEYTTDAFRESTNYRSNTEASLQDSKGRKVSIRTQRNSSLYLAHNIGPQIESYMDRMGDWEFDMLDMRELKLVDSPLVLITMTSLSLHGLLGTLIADESCMVEYLKKVDKSYFDNPYHNSWHAADVVQAMHYALMTCLSDVSFSPLSKCAALIAAAVHDVGHLGVNNAFLISTSHQLALQFSDHSPLEMMHAQKAFSLLHSPGCNYMSEMSKEDRTAMRRMIITMVLQTDNAKHVALLEGFTRLRVSGTLNLDGGEHQLQLLSLTLHSMDVSNVARPWKISRKWLELILIEFYSQGDAERAADIPVTPMMDRNSNVPLPKFQIGFINAIVKPLFVELKNCGMNVDEPIDCLDENINCWETIVNNQNTLSSLDEKKSYVRPSFIQDVESAGSAATNKWLNAKIRHSIMDSMRNSFDESNRSRSNSKQPGTSPALTDQVRSVARQLMRGISTEPSSDLPPLHPPKLDSDKSSSSTASISYPTTPPRPPVLDEK